jgi:hypothetical protein
MGIAAVGITIAYEAVTAVDQKLALLVASAWVSCTDEARAAPAAWTAHPPLRGTTCWFRFLLMGQSFRFTFGKQLIRRSANQRNK